MKHHLNMIVSLDFSGSLLNSLKEMIPKRNQEENSNVLAIRHEWIVVVHVLLERVFAHWEQDSW